MNLNITLPDKLFKTSIPTVSNIPSPGNPDTFRVERIVDGDTIVIEGNKKLRYIGIDTPETTDPKEPAGCFGLEAAIKNKELVQGKYVRLEKDISETDRYGRLLRYVWVYESPAATGSGVFVNGYLVKEGFALASTFPPDVKYASFFASLQEEARRQNKGLWNLCR
jgi:micrococcal nuclease